MGTITEAQVKAPTLVEARDKLIEAQGTLLAAISASWSEEYRSRYGPAVMSALGKLEEIIYTLRN